MDGCGKLLKMQQGIRLRNDTALMHPDAYMRKNAEKSDVNRFAPHIRPDVFFTHPEQNGRNLLRRQERMHHKNYRQDKHNKYPQQTKACPFKKTSGKAF